MYHVLTTMVQRLKLLVPLNSFLLKHICFLNACLWINPLLQRLNQLKYISWAKYLSISRFLFVSLVKLVFGGVCTV